MGQKGKSIDVSKLKSKYYDGDADYTTDFDLTDVQKDLTNALNEEALAQIEGDKFNDVENAITAYIASSPYGKYNNIADENGKKRTAADFITSFMIVYEKFSKDCPLSLMILIFADYFGLDYLSLIRELPNHIQQTLYDNVYSCVKDKSLLNGFFQNDVDMQTKNKLF